MQQELFELYFALKGALKYRLLAIIISLMVCTAAWIYVFNMPNKYESKAKVHIDTATVIRPLMKGMVVEPDVSSMIRIIQQLMFTRPNLEKVVKISLLNKSGGSTDFLDDNPDFYESLKKKIVIKSAGNKDIFDISFTSDDPEVAKSVVQAVLTVFSENTQGKALEDASDAQNFIDQQIHEYETRLQQAEKNKEEFRRVNMDLLFDNDLVKTLQDLKVNLQEATTALNQTQAKRNVLSEQLREVQDSKNGDWSKVSSVPDQALSDDARLKSLKDKKEDLLLKYTDQHPAIAGIDKLIKELENQNSINDNSELNIGVKKLSNPYVQTLKTAYDNVEAQLAADQALVDSLKTRINNLEAGLKEKLSLDTQMKNLNRDYEAINRQYLSLIERREQAHITESIDDQTSRLKFKVAEAPMKPQKPAHQIRVTYYTSILFGGLAFGLLVALLIYFIKPVFMSTRQVRVVTGLPTLGSVSLTTNKNKIIYNERIFYFLCVLLLVDYTCVMTIEFIIN